MFVYHVKINGSKVFKIFLACVIVIILCILAVIFFRIFTGANQASKNSTCTPPPGVSKISAKNYTNILKTVHENIDDYVGIEINFTGYVYRVLDLTDNQFVLARDMIISSDFQTVVVGFLCEYGKAKDYKDNTWVEVTGKITKGDYHGDMPIIKVTNMKQVDKPNEEFVYPPDESYIPTNGIL